MTIEVADVEQQSFSSSPINSSSKIKNNITKTQFSTNPSSQLNLDIILDVELNTVTSATVNLIRVRLSGITKAETSPKSNTVSLSVDYNYASYNLTKRTTAQTAAIIKERVYSPINRCTILHLPDGDGGILCDGSFTEQKRNFSSEENPTATITQKNSFSDPEYFNNSSNILSSFEVVCTNCLKEVRSTYPERYEDNFRHIYKTGQNKDTFTYCGIEIDHLTGKGNRFINPSNLNVSNRTYQKLPTYKSNTICKNCLDGFRQETGTTNPRFVE